MVHPHRSHDTQQVGTRHGGVIGCCGGALQDLAGVCQQDKLLDASQGFKLCGCAGLMVLLTRISSLLLLCYKLKAAG